MVMNNLVFGILSALSLVMIVTFVNSYHGQTAHGHDFSTTDESTFVTLVEQIKAETQLVNTKLLSNDNSSAQGHARNAAELMKQLEGNMTQTNPPSSDITQVYDQGQKNSTTLALVVANIVDDILEKYGSAFAVGYDMTNMSNMMNMDMMTMPNMNNGSPNSMDMMTTTNVANGSSNMSGGHSNTSMIMENDLVLVDMNDYETAQVLSNNIKEQFSTQLRPRSLVNETANLDRLDDSLGKLEEEVNTKASPEAMMDIVHIQIHQFLNHK